MADPSSWSTPALELAPGFKAPLPNSFEALQQYIENSLPAESPVVYGMHPNAELSLLTSLGETLFRTITDVSGGSSGTSAWGGSHLIRCIWGTCLDGGAVTALAAWVHLSSHCMAYSMPSNALQPAPAGVRVTVSRLPSVCQLEARPVTVYGT